jgi:hypothetical protein
MAEGKTHVSVVICGHVDAGKSTTTGRLIYELGGIPEREMEKLRAEADALGKGSFCFAFFMDNQKEERERGGVGGGSESAHHDESGSSPSASSLFIKRTVDEVTIRWIRFTIVKYACDLNQAVTKSKGDQSNWAQRVSCSSDNSDKSFER